VSSVCICLLAGPTALLEVGGLRLLTDPTFDPPGEYPLPGGRVLVKTASAALSPDALGPIDAVLLSHDQHPDNLDRSGRALLARVPLILTTAEAAGRLGGHAHGLHVWETIELARPDGRPLRVIGVQALHGPPGAEAYAGIVTAFFSTLMTCRACM